MSVSALDRLGRRIAESETISEADLADLQRVITTYDELLAVATPRVDQVVEQARRSLFVDLANPTSRPKTIGTIHDKLRRARNTGQGMRLSGMQDLAGIRVVGEMNRRQQDQLCDLLQAEFFHERAAPRRVDRRENPSFGYRAVHVIVYPGRMPVEIQVRTNGQQLWANISEDLADVWGRQIRYGGDPDEPDTVVGAGMTRRDLVMIAQDLSGLLDAAEQAEVEIRELEQLVSEAFWALNSSSDEDRQELEAAHRSYADDLNDAQVRYARGHQETIRKLRSFAELTERIRGAS
jgi:ppGpp synthetase/RelA/SpoT-type nucleotidyltranferase